MENKRRKLVIEKTVNFLNDVRESLKMSSRIENVAHIATAHETSHASFTSAQRLGYITKIGVKSYKCTIDLFEPYHAIKVLEMNSSFYADKKKAKAETIQKSLVENLEDDWKISGIDIENIGKKYLQRLPDAEILKELQRRGITGTIERKEITKF